MIKYVKLLIIYFKTYSSKNIRGWGWGLKQGIGILKFSNNDVYEGKFYQD